MDAEFIPRALEARVRLGLEIYPVVVVEGARGVGKTRLLERLRSDGRISDVRTFLDPTERAAVEADVGSYVASLPAGSALDEAQLVPALLTALKRRIDLSGGPGQFILTGSSRLRRDGLGGTDPLAGRALTLRLEPFSQSELTQTSADALERMLAGNPAEWTFEPLDRPAYLQRAVQGGMPGVPMGETSPNLASYVDDLTLRGSMVTGDGRLLQALLRVLCEPGRVSVPFSYASLSQELDGADVRTIRRYLDQLESLFLIQRIPAFDGKLGQSEGKQAKAQPLDPALVTWASSGARTPAGDGALLESFVGSELTRLASARDGATRLTHWRDTARGREVDRVVDCGTGPLVAIEVKASAGPSIADFAGIEAFARSQRRPVRGFVMCSVDRVLPFGPDRWAVPISALWNKPQAASDTGDPFEQALRRASAARLGARPGEIAKVMGEIVRSRLERIALTIADGYGTVAVSPEVKIDRKWTAGRMSVHAFVTNERSDGVFLEVEAILDADDRVQWLWRASSVLQNVVADLIVEGGVDSRVPLRDAAERVSVQIAEAIPQITGTLDRSPE